VCTEIYQANLISVLVCPLYMKVNRKLSNFSEVSNANKIIDNYFTIASMLLIIFVKNLFLSATDENDEMVL